MSKFLRHQKANLLHKLKDIAGVTTPYYYIARGNRSKTEWHLEDLNFASCNLLHYGDPKLWNFIPPDMSSYFENCVAKEIGIPLKKAIHYLRHKSLSIDDCFYQKYGIEPQKMTQNEGEMVIGKL